jgi:hypothetical protein
MNSNTPFSLRIDSDQLYLEISHPLPISQPNSTSGGRWRSRLNQLCLNAFLPWLQEEYAPTAKVWTNPTVLPTFWELVNGTAIELPHPHRRTIAPLRFVLISSAAIDSQELRVPQEWVDIPSWAADYYLAIQVNVDDGWIRITGYATHQCLKNRGVYDAADRAYCLDEMELVTDLNVLWVTQQFCPSVTLRAEIADLPVLPLAQAQQLLTRLGNASVVFPRLAVPFHLWGALLEHGGWRKQLYERRQGWSEQWSIQQWLQSGVSQVAQHWGWESVLLQPVRAGMRSMETSEPIVSLSRQLVIAGQSYELLVFPQNDPIDRIWHFELRNTLLGQRIPPGFKLRLLSEDLQPFEHNEDTATTESDRLYVDVIVEPGEGLVWETDPLPEGYDREILRF